MINTLVEMCTKCCENTVLLSGVRECDPEKMLFELDFEAEDFSRQKSEEKSFNTVA